MPIDGLRWELVYENLRRVMRTSRSSISRFSSKSAPQRLLYLLPDNSRTRYEPRCYQFVVFECVRKLALTGLLIFM